MIRTAARLTYRIHRFEVGSIVILAGALLLASVGLGLWLASVGLDPACGGVMTYGDVPQSCEAALLSFQSIAGLAGPVAVVMGLFPYIGGLLVGGPVMAREIERGTTSLAWSMSASRLRWYLQRVVPIAVALLAAAYVVGIASEHLQHSLSQATDMSASFYGFRARGVLVATQAFVLFSAAVAVGALLGRAVPTFLLALILGTLSIYALGQLHQKVLYPEAVHTLEDEFGSSSYTPDDLFLDSQFQLPDGRLMSWDELMRTDPSVMEFGPQYPIVTLTIPGERYRFVETREAAAELAIGLGLLVAAAAIISRRRPT
jgi:hypothetical protein